MKNSLSAIVHSLATSGRENMAKAKNQLSENLKDFCHLEKIYQRAEIDKQSMKLRYSDEDFLKKIKDNSYIKAQIHDRLEDIRVQIIGSLWLVGVAYNLGALLKKDHLEFEQKKSYPLEIQLEFLLIQKFFICGSKDLFAKDIPISKKLRTEFIKYQSELEKGLADQQTYHQIIQKILGIYKSCLNKQKEFIKADKELMEINDDSGNDKEQSINKKKKFIESVYSPVSSKTNSSEEFNYKIYSRGYDQVIRAEKLVRSEEISILQNQLNNKYKLLKPISRPIISKLKASLEVKNRPTIKFSNEFGYINSRYLANLLVNPSFEVTYSYYEYQKTLDTVVSLLIDNSGSMRGTPISYAAIIVRMLADILEKFSIKVEILGFTTAEWQGGQVKKLWDKQGNPSHPGRLSETRHIIYKNWNDSYKKTSKNISIMLNPSILKENIDGEALIWAAQRLKLINRKRKVLIAISDGAPVEDMTLKYNNPKLLENHLILTAKEIQKDKTIKLIAFGISHDVSKYYRDHITVSNIKDLGSMLTKKLIELVKEI